MSSQMLPGNKPCLSSTCGSSDARRLYEDGTSFCFSCRSFFPKQDGEIIERPAVKPPQPTFKKALNLVEIASYPTRGFKDRGITKTVTEFFGVKSSYNEEGEIDTHYYPYDNATAYKVRKLPKDFTWVGKSGGLFGKDKFNGGGKRLIIVEGEIDALSIAQASQDRWKKIYPVVAMSSASMTKSLLENREWIRSFEEVVLCLDEDEAGHKAQTEAIRIIGIDKVKLTKLPFKDANEVLVKSGFAVLNGLIFDAGAYVPAGIIDKDKIWDALENYNNAASVPYPPCLEGLNAKLKGMRGGEITLFISGTGSGKSTVLREIMLHVVETTEHRIGVVSLEESPAETARKLSGMVLNRNPAKEEIPLEDLRIGFDKVFDKDKLVVLDHQGSMNDNSIVDQLEYMCLVGCKFLFIDHITIMVSEGVDDLRGNEAQDKIMNDLLRLVKRHPDVWIGLVSHLRKAPGGGKSFEEGKLPSIDDIRGSGSVKQVSFDIIAFARNLTATDERSRNNILMRILKSRYTGLTGNVTGASYEYDTGRLQHSNDMGNEEFTAIS